MSFTFEEIKILLELLTVEQSKHALKNDSLVDKYENIKQKLNFLMKNFK